MNLPKLYKKQISFTEWFESINHDKSKEMREEDNKKRERLAIMYDIIQIPSDQPKKFKATDIVNKTPEFQTFLEEHGEELCALRLVPYNPDLPKLRMRGHTIRNVLTWFSEQDINPADYKANFVPHTDKNTWSTITIVNEEGIFGEIIADGHHRLTQGFHNETKPIAFSYDFNEWKLSENNDEAKEHLKEIIKHIHVPNQEKQQQLREAVNSTFSHDYICGYFETAASEQFGLWFIDYNRILDKMYKGFKPNLTKTEGCLTGVPASQGKVTGKVRIIKDNFIDFQENEILVCDMTTPAFLPLMEKASAIITDLGGVLTHAAIVSRELGKPCITGTKEATSKLQTGDLVEVNADTGKITKL